MTWSTVLGVLAIMAGSVVALIVIIAAVAAAVKATKKPEPCPRCGYVEGGPDGVPDDPRGLT